MSNRPLADTLRNHRVGDLDETGDVCTHNIVALVAEAFGCIVGVVMNGLHDALQLGIDFLTRPAEALGVLGHFKARRGDAASIGGFSWAVHDLRRAEGFDGLRGRGHICAFADERASGLEHELGIVAVEFILARARERAVVLVDELPRILFRHELNALALELGEFAALDVLEVHHLRQEFLGDAVLDDDCARAVGKGDDLCAELHQLLRRERSDIARTGDHADLAFKGFALLLKHIRREVDVAIAGGLGADERTAEGEPLARQNARPFVDDALVLTEEIADFASADVHVARRDIRVSTDMAVKFSHEALAEAHHLGIAAALARRVGALLRVEVGTALAAAHREGRQRVLEDLLKAKELQDREVHRRVEAQTALVWPDCAVVLDAIAAVDTDNALVVNPGNAEHDDTLRLDHAFEDGVLLIGGRGLQDGVESEEDFLDSLNELRFVRVLSLDIVQDGFNVFAHCFPLTLHLWAS